MSLRRLNQGFAEHILKCVCAWGVGGGASLIAEVRGRGVVGDLRRKLEIT